MVTLKLSNGSDWYGYAMDLEITIDPKIVGSATIERLEELFQQAKKQLEAMIE